MASIYDSIKELDRERRRNEGPEVPELTVENYTTRGENSCRLKELVKCANSTNQIRVKNIRTGVLIEFAKMINAARFVGTTGANMRCGFGYEKARVYRVGEEEYVFEYDEKERPLEDGSRCYELDGSVMVVSGKGERIPFPSYLSAAKHLGLLVGHVQEERKRELAKKYVLGKETFTIEFKGERRQKDNGRGIVCHWEGIYDGNFEGISGIKVTYGNPQMRD